jgi:uncharacterized membrane protein
MDDQETAARIESRIARLESELARLANELADLRSFTSTLPAAAPGEPVVPSAVAPPPLEPAPPPPEAPRHAPPVVQPEPREPVAPQGPEPRTLGELARDWDLVGPRGFAIAGGAVTALGIGLFFVLAANRGWIDPMARVLLGALASALVVGAGVLLRAKYGQYLSALAAVGAGVAGAYATLAAAAARYDLVPDALALPLAALIAAVATTIALRWDSQLLAAIGLLGAALAPALQALDSEIGWDGAAFAAIVLVAAGAVAIRRRWHELVVVVALVVGAQIEWLVLAADVRAGLGTVLVAGAFLLILLGIAVARQLVDGKVALDPLALSFALAATGATLLVTVELFQDQTNRGIALLEAGAVWALVFAALHVRKSPEVALVVGSGALALAATGTADLLSDAALTLAWAAQGTLLALLAFRLRDVRLQVLGLAYAILSAAHALAIEARMDYLFERDAEHGRAVLPLAAAGLAFGVAGAFRSERFAPRTEARLLSFIHELRMLLERHRSGVQETLLFIASALMALAAAFGLVAIRFEAGHVAAIILTAAAGAAILALAGRRGSDPLAFAAYYWLGVVVGVAVVFDIPEVSHGGWAALAAAAGLLGGAYGHRVPHPASRARDVVAGVAAGIAALTATIGIDEITGTRIGDGLGLLTAAAVYVALAATIFRRRPLRDFSTTLWSFGLLFLLAAEAVLVDSGSGTLFAGAITGAAVALLARPLAELRLWTAGAIVIGVATASTLAFSTPPSHLFHASQSPADALWVLVGCLIAIIALTLTAESVQMGVRLGALSGGLALYAISLGLLDIAERVSSASIDTDFERGHTAVSALWALVGLGLLLAGLLRGSAVIRYAGLALFGLTLAKIFLYDLAELSSIARAFSFILVGGFLLAGGFFLQRLSDRVGPRNP